METDNKKPLIRLCYASLGICAVWLLLVVIWTKNNLLGPNEPHVHWESEQVALKVAVALLWSLASLSIIALLVSMLFVTLRGIREGRIFQRRNIRLLQTTACVYLIYSLLDSNLPFAFSQGTGRSLTISSDMFVVPLIILLFMQMYKMACRATEENNLFV